MINILIDSLPDYVVVDGKKYKVVTDFREWIRFALLVSSEEVSNELKLSMMLQWYMNDMPKDIAKAIDSLGIFFAGKELHEITEQSDTKETTSSNAVPFDFQTDAADIYASFLLHYRIDLQSIDYMHWYKFRILFEELPPESSIKKKIYYRTVDLNTIKNKEERNRIEEIRQKIKIVQKKKTVVSDWDIGDVFA